MISPIDVIDSAVKIGLGAIISGVATYLLAKTRHDKELEKERMQRKRDMLETIAEQVATFDQAALAHWEKVINWLAFSPASEPMSPELRRELVGLHDQIKERYKDLKSAEAKLLLLGEASCQMLLREYAEFVEVHREDSIERRLLNVDKLKVYKIELRKKREEFFAGLSAIYKSI